jgi:hypothetical protein
MSTSPSPAYLRTFAWALLFALGVTGNVFAQQASLADIARREADRRKEIAQPSKVYTNADIMPYGPPAPSPVASAERPLTTPSAFTPTEQTPPNARRAEYCESCEQQAAAILRSQSARREFMQATGYPNGRNGWTISHVIPLACGGGDDPSNMQWQTETEANLKARLDRLDCSQFPTTQPLSDFTTWRPPVVRPPIAFPPSCGGNTPREQAMSRYMKDAGFGGATAPLPPCQSASTGR